MYIGVSCILSVENGTLPEEMGTHFFGMGTLRKEMGTCFFGMRTLRKEE